MKTKPNLYRGFSDEAANLYPTAWLDGYSIAERLLEGVRFNFTVESDGALSVAVDPRDQEYISDLNGQKWLKRALEYAQETDFFSSRETDEDLELVPITPPEPKP